MNLISKRLLTKATLLKFLFVIRLTAITVAILLMVLCMLAGLISRNGWLDIGWMSASQSGGLQSQVYLQTVNEKGVLLFGRRSERSYFDHQVSSFRFSVEYPKNNVKYKESDRVYKYGFSETVHDKPKQNFKAHYIFVLISALKYWTGVVLFLLVLPDIYRIIRKMRSRKSKPENQPAKDTRTSCSS